MAFTSRRNIGLAVRFAIGAAILAWLFSRMPLNDLGDVLSGTLERWPWLLAGIGFTFLGLFTGSLRWYFILRGNGFRLSVTAAARIFFIGQFFNAFFLGACGGDLARVYYVMRDRPERRGTAALTVLIDRAIGLIDFMLVGSAMIIARGQLLAGDQKTRIALALMGTFLVVAALGALVLFRRNLFETWPFFRKIEENTRLGPLLRNGYEAVYFYRHHPRLLAIAGALSFLNLCWLTLACWAFAHSLGIALPFHIHLTFFPVITVFSAIPITPGALGIREGLFAHLYLSVGVAAVRAVPLSLLVYAGGVVWSLFGGFLFVLSTPETMREIRDEVEELVEREVDGNAEPSAGLEERR
jgi:hypothetical protein